MAAETVSLPIAPVTKGHQAWGKFHTWTVVALLECHSRPHTPHLPKHNIYQNLQADQKYYSCWQNSTGILPMLFRLPVTAGTIDFTGQVWGLPYVQQFNYSQTGSGY